MNSEALRIAMQDASEQMPKRRTPYSRPRQRRVPTVIVDESALFRTGLSHTLAGTRFHVRSRGATLQELPEEAYKGDPCLALIGLPKASQPFLADVCSLMERHKAVRVVILTERFYPDDAMAAIAAGARGCLLKNEINAATLLQSLELVMLGVVVVAHGFTKLPGTQRTPDLRPADASEADREIPADDPKWPALAVGRVADPHLLSSRERMILQQLTQGASNKVIARELNISEATVKVHVKSILRKLRVSNRTQAAMWAIDNPLPDKR